MHEGRNERYEEDGEEKERGEIPPPLCIHVRAEERRKRGREERNLLLLPLTRGCARTQERRKRGHRRESETEREEMISSSPLRVHVRTGKRRREDCTRKENSWILFKKEEVMVEDGDGEEAEEEVEREEGGRLIDQERERENASLSSLLLFFSFCFLLFFNIFFSFLYQKLLFLLTLIS